MKRPESRSMCRITKNPTDILVSKFASKIPSPAMSCLVVLCLLLTGCMQLSGEHLIGYAGTSDTFGYTLKIPDWVLKSEGKGGDQIREGVSGIIKSSKPRISESEGIVTIQDVSGAADSKAFYDEQVCYYSIKRPKTVVQICHYLIKRDVEWNFTDWSVSWVVYLKPGVEVIATDGTDLGNDRRGYRQIGWYFDGNKVNNFGINLTVMRPVQSSR